MPTTTCQSRDEDCAVVYRREHTLFSIKMVFLTIPQFDLNVRILNASLIQMHGLLLYELINSYLLHLIQMNYTNEKIVTSRTIMYWFDIGFKYKILNNLLTKGLSKMIQQGCSRIKSSIYSMKYDIQYYASFFNDHKNVWNFYTAELFKLTFR